MICRLEHKAHVKLAPHESKRLKVMLLERKRHAERRDFDLAISEFAQGIIRVVA